MSDVELVVVYNTKVGEKFVVERVDLDDTEAIAALPTEGVLMMALSALDAVRPRLNGRRRVEEILGRDHYGYVRRGENAMLYGWDDGDFIWRNLSDPFMSGGGAQPDHLPLVGMSTTFDGAQVGTGPDDAEWQRALVQFQAEVH